MRDARAALNQRRWLVFAMCLFTSLPASSAFAEQLDWLYDASVEIDSQAEADQRDAARRALMVVLSRVSGLRHVPRNRTVTEALRNPQNFYSQFRFETVTEGDEASLRMVVRFDVAAIMELVGDARLPVWTIDRPRVLMWAVVAGQGARRLVLRDDPLLETIRSVARSRGINVSLPTAESVNHLQLVEIWGGFWESIVAASAGYAADVVAIAQVDAESRRIAWELRSLDAAVARPFQGDGISWRRERLIDDPMSTLTNGLADDLAQELAVLNRGVQHFDLHVSGIRTVDDYADLLEFLTTREYLDRVDLKRVVARDMEFVLRSRSSRGQLEKLLLLSARFARDGTRIARGGAPLALRWEGS